MSTETKTVRMGVHPNFARFIASAVADRNVSFIMGRKEDDREERIAAFRDMAVTYLIGHLMIEQGLDGEGADINDYAITLTQVRGCEFPKVHADGCTCVEDEGL